MRFDSKHFGDQGFSRDDLQSRSRYAEVKAAMFHNTYYLNWGEEGEPPLPTYEVTLGRILRGILPGAMPWLFKHAAARTVESHAALRWGKDRLGYRRLLHPNGICLFGRWIIDSDNPYTGHFRNGTEALIVGRYSTCCTETRRGFTRSLSLVGKLYPTVDEHHPQPLETGDFITQQDLGGDFDDYINDAQLLNAPDVTPWRRGWGFPILLISGLVFKLLNREPAIRQLHTIAELGKPGPEQTCAPEFMRLRVSEEQPRIAGQQLDFRDEILAQLYDRGSSVATGRKLTFIIEVTDEGTKRGMLVQRRTFSSWRKIGRIEFTEAVASYNADFVLHFNHPIWRTDKNDPATAVKPGLRRTEK